MKPENVKIFDTSLRDGEQSPGFSMNIEEKLRMARQLAKLKVDVIEAGFPIASKGDFEAVSRVAKEIEGPTIAGLSRANQKDIDRCWEAVQHAQKPRIHTFIATSDIHLEHKLKKSRAEVLQDTISAVKHAKSYTDDVEFSAEDATRSDWSYLSDVIEAAIQHGAKTVNIPDTVGYTVPSEYFNLITHLKQNVKNIDQAIISVHCHNDLGLAVANSLAAIQAGARQVECTINGIGERAGNAALEEIVMALKVRSDLMGCDTNINTEQIYSSSKLLSLITGVLVQPNKAIVGENAFAHEAGIHQDGILKNQMTYEIMTPKSVGWSQNNLVLGKHSGSHAFKSHLQELGFELSEVQLKNAFESFKALADRKKEIYDDDLVALVTEQSQKIEERYQLDHLHVSCGTGNLANSKVSVKINGQVHEGEVSTEGPVEAIFKTIRQITESQSVLKKFKINAITGGIDAQGEVSVTIEDNGKEVRGIGTHTDILVASALAYINALNRLALFEQVSEKGI